MATAPCRYCNEPITYNPIEVFGNPVAIAPSVCSKCHTAIVVPRQEMEQQEQRLDQWAQMCPAAYWDTDPNHPGMPHPTNALNRILGWQGPRGLVVMGNSRRGKTRSMWLLIKRLILEGKSVLATTSNAFANTSAQLWSRSADDAVAWLDHLIAAPILFLDDLGKFKLTERVETDLFHVIDTRISELRPVLSTTNLTTEALKAVFSENRGEPFVGRLIEFCDCVIV